jgi:hypothetical protein
MKNLFFVVVSCRVLSSDLARQRPNLGKLTRIDAVEGKYKSVDFALNTLNSPTSAGWVKVNDSVD